MPKFTIEIDTDTHQILKQRAKEDERSLTQYMQRILRQSAGTLVIPTTTTQQDTSKLATTLPPQPQQQTVKKPLRRIIGDDESTNEPTVDDVVKFLDKEEIPSDDDSRALFERY